MALPLGYNFRNVLVRWRSTLATILGVALVVAVYVLLQFLAIGLEKSSGNTGAPRNVMVVRKGSTAESSSQITREQVRLMQDWEEIARDDSGRVLLTADVLVLITSPAAATTAKPMSSCAASRLGECKLNEDLTVLRSRLIFSRESIRGERSPHREVATGTSHRRRLRFLRARTGTDSATR